MVKKIKGELSQEEVLLKLEDKYPDLFEALKKDYISAGRNIPASIIELIKIIIKL